MAVIGLLTTAALAQEIGPGEITVRLEAMTTGLGGELHVTPTDLVPLHDGSGRMAVATITGIVRLIDQSGTFLDSVDNPFLDTRNEPFRLIPPSFGFGMTGIDDRIASIFSRSSVRKRFQSGSQFAHEFMK